MFFIFFIKIGTKHVDILNKINTRKIRACLEYFNKRIILVFISSQLLDRKNVFPNGP